MLTVDQFKRAFLAIQNRITPGQLSMLKAHHAAAGRSATMTHLAQAGGYENYAVANLQYVKLGHLLSDVLGAKTAHRTGRSRSEK